jgi:6-phosphogluconolactonase/glucosamine-6-phosphate isomerase/deaminase
MEFLRIQDEKIGAKLLADKIGGYLEQDKKVLWLLSGGSNISISILVFQILKSKYSAIIKNNLAVTLTDERYGVVGHPDSNWQQLLEAGFDFSTIKSVPVLFDLDLDETVKKFNKNYIELINWADITIGQFGLGADGHVAGVLPDTFGVTSNNTACGYDGGKFTRVTVTLNTIKNINIAFTFAFGEAKKDVIEILKSEKISLTHMPAQILKQVQESYLYTDQN